MLSGRIINLFFAFLLCLGVLFSGAKYHSSSTLHVGKIAPYTEIHCDEYSIDKLEKKDNQLFITGWSVIKGTPIKIVKVGLKDLDGGEVFWKNNFSKRRTDVTAKFNDGINYDESGFETALNFEHIPKNREYALEIAFVKLPVTRELEQLKYSEISRISF